MVEALVFCAAMVIGGYLVDKFQRSRVEREDLAEEEQEKASQPEPPIILDIQSRDTIIGHFRGLPIYKFVVIRPNRLFHYESILVELQPGIPYVDAPDQNYIIVDQVFLYREIPVLPE